MKERTVLRFKIVEGSKVHILDVGNILLFPEVSHLQFDKFLDIVFLWGILKQLEGVGESILVTDML